MDRAKFYSVDDFGNYMQLSRAQIVLDNYVPDNTTLGINDILELYNVKLLLDNKLALKTWDEETIVRYNKIASGFGKDIVVFYSSHDVSILFDEVEFQYQQDFWDVFEKFGLLDILTEDLIGKIFAVHPEQIENVLHCEKIVKQFDNCLADWFMSFGAAAALLLNAYYVSDVTSHERELYIPKSLSLEQKEHIVANYLESGNPSLNTVRIIMQSKDTDGLKLSPKTRLKAAKLEPELSKIPEDAIVSYVTTGFSIEYINDQDRPNKQEILDELVLKYIYNEHHLDGMDNTKLLNVFHVWFHYLDKNGLLTLCNNRREDVIFEKIDTQEVRGLYRMNSAFRMKNNVAVSQLAMFDTYLRRKGKRLEELIKDYFEKHFKEDYGFPSLPINMPKDDDCFANKNKIIAPEMEAIVNQFNLFVEEGEIDPELYYISMPLPLTLAKSLLNGRHKYVVICDVPNEIYRPMHYLFSDQSLLSNVEPHKDKPYHTLFDLLLHEGFVKYENYESHQIADIDYLIGNGYLINDNGKLTFGNMPRIFALCQLYKRGEISYYHCNPDVRKEIDEMVKAGWLKYDEYLLSPSERQFVNFYMNNSEYSNGFQLRNKYSHGRSSCTQSDAEHKNAYYYFLMIFVILLLKMDEDMRMSIYLNGKVK